MSQCDQKTQRVTLGDHLMATNPEEVKSLLGFKDSKRVIMIKAKKKKQRPDMCQSVCEGLRQIPQKELSSTYFYDEQGSKLYEEITRLPEYYPTRTERVILETIADELLSLIPIAQLIELGSGSSEKTRVLFNASHAHSFIYIPIDVSDTMLGASAQQLTTEYPDLNILAIAGDYENALHLLPPSSNRLFLFLGGTIGNFTQTFQAYFFTSLLKQMSHGDHLLIGFDRAAHDTKPPELIENAYNDAQGITAQFNLNILNHINRQLQANFVLEQFQHRAVYNPKQDQIEMHLVSQCNQAVTIGSDQQEENQTFHLAKDETILTELSRKFHPEQLQKSFEMLGYTHAKTWEDANRHFGLMLLKKR